MDNIFKILNFLPAEIIYMILPYTYQPQSQSLMNDIQNFYSTRNVANKLFYTRFVIEFNEPEPSDKYWFINDLFAFSNKFPTMNGYSDKFVNIFLRNFSLKTNADVLTYIQRTELLKVTTQINIFWGLFTLEERNAFLKKFFPENIIA